MRVGFAVEESKEVLFCPEVLDDGFDHKIGGRDGFTAGFMRQSAFDLEGNNSSEFFETQIWLGHDLCSARKKRR